MERVQTNVHDGGDEDGDGDEDGERMRMRMRMKSAMVQKKEEKIVQREGDN